MAAVSKPPHPTGYAVESSKWPSYQRGWSSFSHERKGRQNAQGDWKIKQPQPLGYTDLHSHTTLLTDYDLVGQIVKYRKHRVPLGETNKKVLEPSAMWVRDCPSPPQPGSSFRVSDIPRPFTINLLWPIPVKHRVLCRIMRSTFEAGQNEYTLRSEPQIEPLLGGCPVPYPAPLPESMPQRGKTFQ